MKYLALTCALLLGGCAVHKPAASPTAPGSEPIGADALPLDSTSARLPVGDREFVRVNPDTPNEAGPSRGTKLPLLKRVFGGKSTAQPSKTQTLAGVASAPRKCKGCVFNVVAGDQTNTSAAKKSQVAAGPGAMLTSIEKPRAAVAAGAGAVASDYRKQGQRGGAAASGAGATATATTSKGFPWWLLLIPVVGYAAYRVNKRFTIF